MKINGVTIQMLPAASGDCIYLEFPDSDFRMLIDGGYAKTYQKYLKKFLLKLAAEGKRLNLIVVTHIDDDHISGIRALLKENGDSRNPKIIEIDEIWFNSLNQCITSRNAEQGIAKIVRFHCPRYEKYTCYRYSSKENKKYSETRRPSLVFSFHKLHLRQ